MVKTKNEIVKETREYYENNPRGIGKYACYYYKEVNGVELMCAVGRCIKDVKTFVLDPINTGAYASELDLESILKDEYKGHPKLFWINLQQFHDFPLNWDGNKLTELGERKFKELLNEDYN